jgi:antitoxin CptB
MAPGKAVEVEERLKRLRLRAWRRGTREMDLLLGPFADRMRADGNISEFEDLLARDDPEIEAWFWHRAPVPAGCARIIAALRAFHKLT